MNKFYTTVDLVKKVTKLKSVFDSRCQWAK